MARILIEISDGAVKRVLADAMSQDVSIVLLDLDAADEVASIMFDPIVDDSTVKEAFEPHE